MKAIIISRPKAGTYLCSELLKQWGMHQTYYHLLGGNRATVYEEENLATGRAMPSKFNKSIQLKNIPDNGFLVTHVYNVKSYKKAFQNFKKIILTRNVSDCIKSAERFSKETGRRYVNPKNFNVENWLKEPNTFELSFIDMIEKNKIKLDELQTYLFEEVKFDSIKTMEAALEAKTLTKSSIREGNNW